MCGGFLALLFRVSAQVGDGFLQAAKGLIVNGAVFKFLNIPKGLVWGDILVFPGLKGQGGLLPSGLAFAQALQKLVQGFCLFFQVLITG